MARIEYDNRLMADPALLRYDPAGVYTFRMPGSAGSRYFIAALILGAPGILFLLTWRESQPRIDQILSVALMAVLIAGLISRLFINKVILTPEELLIHKDHHVSRVRLHDIEEAFIVERAEDLDALPLPPGRYPMEFEQRDRRVVVLVLRDGVLNRSTAATHDGIPVHYVSFNVSKPHRFLAFLRMRA